jgi:hypothetical protein
MKRSETIDKKAAPTNGDQMLPRLLPLKRAAEFLGLTVWAMRERMWAGHIPVVRFQGGREMCIDIRDIEQFIERNKMTYSFSISRRAASHPCVLIIKRDVTRFTVP